MHFFNSNSNNNKKKQKTIELAYLLVYMEPVFPAKNTQNGKVAKWDGRLKVASWRFHYTRVPGGWLNNQSNPL